MKFKIASLCVIFMLLSSGFCMATTLAKSNQISNSMQASSHFAEVNGIRLHYVEMGNGPLIILLHGWPETSYSWKNVMQALSSNYKVVAPDLRGLGLSEHAQGGYDKKTIAADIKALIQYLGATRAVVIGHDMGGKVAYVMAHLYPQLTSKLVLVDCLIPGTENADALHGGSWHYGFHMASTIPEILTQGREKEYIGMLIKTWSYKKDAIGDDTIAEYAKHYATPGGMTAGFNYYRALKEDAAFVDTFRGQKLPMPVLTISGLYGVGDKLPKALKSESPNLQSIIVSDSGHFVAEESPEIFIETVKKFLATYK